MSDYMELGNTGFVILEDGWYLNKRTGEKISPEGDLYNAAGELVESSDDDE